MPHEALEEYLPGPDGKPELYKAAGKLKGKKGMSSNQLGCALEVVLTPAPALITGGEYVYLERSSLDHV